MGHRYRDLEFCDDFLTATRADDRCIRLSRLERAVISALTARPGRLFTRDRLLSAMTSEPDRVSDRNVDFIINRLRRKLGDSARKPRFIATQYGEGYVWIAPPEAPSAAPGFLVIGPVRLPPSPALAGRAEVMLGRLRDALSGTLHPSRRVTVDPDWRPGQQPEVGASLEAAFIVDEDGAGAVAALVLRAEPSRRVLAVERLRLARRLGDAAVDDLAQRIVSALWRLLALAPGDPVLPSDEPLHLRMRGAAMLLNPSRQTWLEMERRLAERQAAASEAPRITIMRGFAQHARLVYRQAGDPADPATYTRPMEALEPRLLEALPKIEGDPVLTLAAAKLLFLTGHGHEALAEQLASEALATSTAFATALPLLGQCKAWRGDLEGAIVDFDQALSLCARDSEFEVYLLALKSGVLLAQNDHAGALELMGRLLQIKPAALRVIGLTYLPPGDAPPTPQLRDLLEDVTPREARTVLVYQYYMGARYFGVPDHAANNMRGPIEHLTRRFGAEVAPPEMLRALSDRLVITSESRGGEVPRMYGAVR